jgi:hypothetical protein
MAVASSRFVLLLLLSDNIPMIVNKARGKKEKETEKKDLRRVVALAAADIPSK